MLMDNKRAVNELGCRCGLNALAFLVPRVLSFEK